METGFLDRVVTVGAEQRRFVVYNPLVTTSEPLPAILFLHGRGECGTDGLFQLINGLLPAIVRNRTDWPFLAVFPQKKEHDAEWFDEKPMISAVLKAVDSEFKTDPHRRYLTGLSQGGRGTLRLAKHLPWQFAALAAVCGWADPEICAKELADTPLWLFHGEKDNVILPERSKEVYEAVKASGGEVKLTLYPDANHNSWDNAYQKESLGKWFLGHSLA